RRPGTDSSDAIADPRRERTRERSGASGGRRDRRAGPDQLLRAGDEAGSRSSESNAATRGGSGRSLRARRAGRGASASHARDAESERLVPRGHRSAQQAGGCVSGDYEYADLSALTRTASWPTGSRPTGQNGRTTT